MKIRLFCILTVNMIAACMRRESIKVGSIHKVVKNESRNQKGAAILVWKPLVWCRKLRLHEKKKPEPIFKGGILSHIDPTYMYLSF